MLTSRYRMVFSISSELDGHVAVGNDEPAARTIQGQMLAQGMLGRVASVVIETVISRRAILLLVSSCPYRKAFIKTQPERFHAASVALS